MENPVFAADGYTYERSNIEEWLRDSNESPITKELLTHKNLIPNHQLHGEIEVAIQSDFPVANDPHVSCGSFSLILSMVVLLLAVLNCRIVPERGSPSLIRVWRGRAGKS
jgi:hypothetical protein